MHTLEEYIKMAGNAVDTIACLQGEIPKACTNR